MADRAFERSKYCWCNRLGSVCVVPSLQAGRVSQVRSVYSARDLLFAVKYLNLLLRFRYFLFAVCLLTRS